MPSRKQRRRRQKERRHEYEYVYVDDEGQEVALEEVEPAVAQRNGAARKKSAPSEQPRSPGQQRSGGRTVQPPSWNRVFKRAAIFAPLMFVTIYLIDRGIGTAGVVLVTAQMLVIFLPFSYLMDRVMYRRSLRQAGSAEAKPTRRRS